jgi:MSHA biogenesis protein MshE
MDAEHQHARPTASPAARERHHKWQPLGQLLIGRGLLTQEQLTAAFERQRQGAQRLGRVLVEQSLISEAALLECLADQFNKTLMTEEELTSLPAEVFRILPEETSRGNMVLAVERSARRLVVATADPLKTRCQEEFSRRRGG